MRFDSSFFRVTNTDKDLDKNAPRRRACLEAIEAEAIRAAERMEKRAPHDRPVVVRPYDGRGNLSYAGPSPLNVQRVRGALAELQRLEAKYGKTKAAVMLTTGLTSEEIDEVGGLPEKD